MVNGCPVKSDHPPPKLTAVTEEMLGKKRLVMCVGYISEVNENWEENA